MKRISKVMIVVLGALALPVGISAYFLPRRPLLIMPRYGYYRQYGPIASPYQQQYQQQYQQPIAPRYWQYQQYSGQPIAPFMIRKAGPARPSPGMRAPTRRQPLRSILKKPGVTHPFRRQRPPQQVRFEDDPLIGESRRGSFDPFGVLKAPLPRPPVQQVRRINTQYKNQLRRTFGVEEHTIYMSGSVIDRWKNRVFVEKSGPVILQNGKPLKPGMHQLQPGDEVVIRPLTEIGGMSGPVAVFKAGEVGTSGLFGARDPWVDFESLDYRVLKKARPLFDGLRAFSPQK